MAPDKLLGTGAELRILTVSQLQLITTLQQHACRHLLVHRFTRISTHYKHQLPEHGLPNPAMVGYIIACAHGWKMDTGISFQGYDVTNNSTDIVNGMSEADACRIGSTVPALFMASHTDGRQRVNSGPHSDCCSMLSDPHTPSHSGQKFHMQPQ